MLQGAGFLLDRAPAALVALAWAAKIAAPLLVIASAPDNGGWRALGVAALAEALGRLSAIRPRAGATPVRDDALWLLGCGLLLAAPIETFVGLIAGTVVVAVLLAGQWFGWGRSPLLVQVWRPTLRVHGDNPDVCGATGRIRLPDNLRVELRQESASFVSVALVGLGHSYVSAIESADLVPRLKQQGRVLIAVQDDFSAPSPDVDFVLRAPPGRYMLTVRAYEIPREGWTPPRLWREA